MLERKKKTLEENYNFYPASFLCCGCIQGDCYLNTVRGCCERFATGTGLGCCSGRQELLLHRRVRVRSCPDPGRVAQCLDVRSSLWVPFSGYCQCDQIIVCRVSCAVNSFCKYYLNFHVRKPEIFVAHL